MLDAASADASDLLYRSPPLQQIRMLFLADWSLKAMIELGLHKNWRDFH